MTGSGGRPPARFLLAVTDAGGTVSPALSLATELVQRGHQVRVLADPTIETSARSAGCTFSPWHEAPHFNSRGEQTALVAALEGRQAVPSLSGCQGLRRKGHERAGSPVTLSRRFETFPANAILADPLPGILIGAQATRRPTAVLVAQTYVRPTPGLPLLGTEWSPGLSLLGNAKGNLAPRIASPAADSNPSAAQCRPRALRTASPRPRFRVV